MKVERQGCSMGVLGPSATALVAEHTHTDVDPATANRTADVLMFTDQGAGATDRPLTGSTVNHWPFAVLAALCREESGTPAHCAQQDEPATTPVASIPEREDPALISRGRTPKKNLQAEVNRPSRRELPTVAHSGHALAVPTRVQDDRFHRILVRANATAVAKPSATSRNDADGVCHHPPLSTIRRSE